MRIVIASFLLCVAVSLAAQKPISLEDIWQNGTFSTKGVPGFNFQKDGVHYTRLNGSVLEEMDLRTGLASGTVFNAADVQTTAAGWESRFDGYTFSADESKLLLSTRTEPIYRYSSQSDFFVADLQANTVTRLHEGTKQRYAHFSPDASKVAFVADNDLYVRDLRLDKTIRVTTDGQKNHVINGASDWVYEEEFELVRAFEWSPDGNKIAFLRFDESQVPEMTLDFYKGSVYPDEYAFKYPKVGEKNAVVTAWIHDLATGKTLEVNTGAAADDYLPRIDWTPQGQLCLVWMNRHQNTLRLLLADAATGQCATLLEETSKYYIELHNPVFLSDGSGFLWQSERSGFNHLYRFDMKGRLQNAVTQGPWDMTGFYGVDEKNDLVYFQTASESPMRRDIYQARLNGKGLRKISDTPGTHSAQFSKTFDYFIDTYSTLNSPPQFSVRDRKNKEIRVLETNDAVRAKQEEYGAIPAEFFSFETAQKVSLNGFMIRPTASPYANQKLPVLMFVYGGPGSQQVLDQWKGANYWWFQMLAQKGYVVACVDNRGTGGRGEEFQKMTYLNLGKYETQDQIEAAKYLGTLPFVDPGRVGIFGWSYGGYMSSLCMLKGKDVFKTGIAVAPVTNWKWYDSVYTERYMQTEQENPKGYAENSPVNFADQLEGNYLLVHGLTDDNVHFQHTAEMSNRLIAANKQFDTMIYPNNNHGITGKNARLHLYTLMTRFLDEKLKGKTEEKVVRP